MKKIIIHILDRKVIYVVNKRISIITTDLYLGKVNNEERFLKDIQKTNREHKVNQRIIGDEVIIITNDFYSKQDNKYLNQLFIELQFNKIKIIKESELVDDIYLIIDNDTTKLFLPNDIIHFNTSLLSNKFLNQIIYNYPFINKVKIINYTTSQKLKLSKDPKLYIFTNPYNLLIDCLMQDS